MEPRTRLPPASPSAPHNTALPLPATAQVILRYLSSVATYSGTDGSNLASSSGESGANRNWPAGTSRSSAEAGSGAILHRGTDGSNPSPSSRQSVSRPHPLSKAENPGFPRGCARPAWRPGRQRRAGCFDIAPTGGNISVGPYCSTAVPLMGLARMPRRSQRTRGSGLNVK
jgi:hypothetical protein